MRFHRAVVLGLLISATPQARDATLDGPIVCTTHGDTTTCLRDPEFSACERNVLVAYGLSMPDREASVRRTFSSDDVLRAQPLAESFKALPERERSDASFRARALCQRNERK